MITIDDLTDEIKAKIPEYIAKTKNDLYSGVEAANWRKENTIAYINKVYEYCELKLPVVVVADNPIEYRKFYNHLFNEKYNEKFNPLINSLFTNKNNGEPYVDMDIEELLRKEEDVIEPESPKHDYLFITSEYARVYLMWYKFLSTEFNIKFDKSEILDWFHEHVNKASIARCYFTEEICLVLRMPSKIIRNNSGFHSPNEPAIQFAGGFGMYYLNNRNIPLWVYEKYENKTLEFNDLIECTNEDIKAGIITLIKEREGNEGLMKFLNAHVTDEQVVNHANGYQEVLKLWKTKQYFDFLTDRHGVQNQPYAWIEMICPSTGQTYLIDTCPSFKNAIECAKWHRPKNIPDTVPYIWQSAN